MRVEVKLEIEIPKLTKPPTIDEVSDFVAYETGYTGFLSGENPFMTSMDGKTADGVEYKFDVENFEMEIIEEDDYDEPKVETPPAQV